jgi:hypothetical protein
MPRAAQPAVREDHSGVPEVDTELLAVLRLLQVAFGDVEVLEVIDDTPASGQPSVQGWLFDGGPPAPNESKSRLPARKPLAEAADPLDSGAQLCARRTRG